MYKLKYRSLHYFILFAF